MALDPVLNFAKVDVDGGFAAAATAITLIAGEGAKLPQPTTDGEFNLTWWDESVFSDPSDDPNVEIVRVTARATDALTVVRAQEGTADTSKNTGGSTYKMVLSPTKKKVDDIEESVGIQLVPQTTHGFSVGDALRSSGTDNEYTEAQADSAANAEYVGTVVEVVNANLFILQSEGIVDVPAAVPASTAGDILFLSEATAGLLTTTEPTGIGEVSKPIGLVLEGGDKMLLVNYRGTVIAAAAAAATPQLTYASIFEDVTTRYQVVIVAGGLNGFDANGNLLTTSATISSAVRNRINQGSGSGMIFTSGVEFAADWVLITAPTTGIAVIGIGNYNTTASDITMTADQFGFKAVYASSTQVLSASNADGTTETATDTGETLTVTDSAVYHAIQDGSTNVKFYRSKVLEATHTTNLPDTATFNVFSHQVSNKDTATNYRVASGGYSVSMNAQ